MILSQSLWREFARHRFVDHFRCHQNHFFFRIISCRSFVKLSIRFLNHFMLVNQLLWISRSPSPQRANNRSTLFCLLVFGNVLFWKQKFFENVLLSVFVFSNKSSSKTFFMCFLFCITRKYLKLLFLANIWSCFFW